MHCTRSVYISVLSRLEPVIICNSQDVVRVPSSFAYSSLSLEYVMTTRSDRYLTILTIKVLKDDNPLTRTWLCGNNTVTTSGQPLIRQFSYNIWQPSDNIFDNLVTIFDNLVTIFDNLVTIFDNLLTTSCL